MADPAAPRPPLRFPLGAAVLAIVVAVVQVGALEGLAYLGLRALGHDSTTGTLAEPGRHRLAQPVQFRPVTAQHAMPCRSGEIARRSANIHACYRLGSGGMTVTALESISVTRGEDGEGYGLDLSLLTRDVAKFAHLTGRLAGQPKPRNQLAIVVAHHVVLAPVVQSRIARGEVRLSGGMTRREAQHLAHQITG